MSDVTEALTIQFLTFMAEGRSYREVMDAWRTACPRMTIWEDALIDGLVQIERAEGETGEQARVTLTGRGRARLAAEAAANAPEPKIVAAQPLRADALFR